MNIYTVPVLLSLYRQCEESRKQKAIMMEATVNVTECNLVYWIIIHGMGGFDSFPTHRS